MNRYHNTKGGAGNEKMKKFPRILDYLEVYHKDVYSLIDDLAMHSALTPKRGGSITFLIPDKKYVAKIRKTIESDKPEEATDMIGSLILLDLFDKPSSFSDKQDDIPNLLGKKLIVKDVSGNKVLVEDGELTLDTKFKPFERQGTSKRGNLAVWELKGEVKYVDAPKATFKYLKTSNGKTQKTVGGSEHNEIVRLMDKIAKDEIECIRNTISKDNIKSPMLNAVARIMRGLKNNINLNDEFIKARSLLTKHPVIDFYILFKTPDVFPPNRILEAYTFGNIDIDSNVDTIKNFFEGSVGDAAVLNPDSLNLLSQARDREVDDILEKINIKMNDKIIKAYNELDEHNKLVYEDKVYFSGKVYPDILIDIFRKNKGMHLALDEAKYFIYHILRNFKYDPLTWVQDRESRAKAYEDILYTIKECYGKIGDPNKSMILRPYLDSNDIYQSVAFWKEFGLHFPQSSRVNFDNEASNRIVRGGNEDMNIYSKELIDVNKEIENELDKYDNSELRLSDNTLRELKAYLKTTNGKFPEL